MRSSLVIIVLHLALSNLHGSCDTLKIMPVGNSITAGEHHGFPVLEERTGYRKPLFEMLYEAGYNVDFVGSQNHGMRPVEDDNWYDWNCEAYPGWKIPEISGSLKTALETYKPDILLVHVGTNGREWDEKPRQVKEMLDMIDSFSVRNNHTITVLLSLIINRFSGEDPAPTTRFNNEVADMAIARRDDKIRIIVVDMEKGAGIDYTDNLPDTLAVPPYEGGDMLGKRYPGVDYDRYHPNDKGNMKMAVKYFEELKTILPAPQTPEIK
ncbi:MAG: hypothetical protein IH591_12260 [Bacteroidales bacterium]|nr:hypothetical protein [Bacteroidales bacterium]